MATDAGHLREADNVVPLDGLDDIAGWVVDKFQLVSAVFVSALLYAGVLYYTWTPFASAIKHGEIHGFWNSALAALGLFGVIMLVRDALADRLYNPWRLFKGGVPLDQKKVSKRTELFATAVRPGAILLIAWLIAEYIS